jgi:hypothetical protein
MNSRTCSRSGRKPPPSCFRAAPIRCSPTLKNRLRSSPELGTGFLKEKIMPYTLAEATFVSADVEGGRWRTISGIAADTDGGHGILTLLQTFPRRYQHQGLRMARSALCRVDCGGFGERRSVPQVTVGKAEAAKMTTVLPCEFVVGNAGGAGGGAMRGKR